MKRLFTLALIVVGLASVGGVLVWLLAPQPIDVDVKPVELGTMLVTVDEDGQTRIRDAYTVSAPFTGRLLRIRLNPGDSVVQGETILAVMTPPSLDLLDPRATAVAEARLAAAQTRVERALSSVAESEAALEYARTELTRAEELFARKNLSEAQRDTQAWAVRLREEELRRAQLEKTIAEFEQEQAQAALLQASQDPTESVQARVEIRSPIDGQVLRVFQESEANIGAGTPLLEIGSKQDLEVVVDVLSSDAVRIQDGARALLHDWGGESPLEAHVRLVEPQGFTKISALGVEEQRVNVILDLDTPPEQRENLGAGFRVQAAIQTWRGEDVVQAPVSALFRDQEKTWSVFVVEDGKARRRTVEIGKRNDLTAQVLDSLQPGDLVISHPSDKLTDGSLVRHPPVSANR